MNVDVLVRKWRRVLLVALPVVAVVLVMVGAWPEAAIVAACWLVALLLKPPGQERWW